MRGAEVLAAAQSMFNQKRYADASKVLKEGYALDAKNKPIVQLLKKCKTQAAVR